MRSFTKHKKVYLEGSYNKLIYNIHKVNHVIYIEDIDVTKKVHQSLKAEQLLQLF